MNNISYYIDIDSGKPISPENYASGRRRKTIMLIQRSALLFNYLEIAGGTKLKDAELLAIQDTYTPYPDRGLSLIYRATGAKKTQFYAFSARDRIEDPNRVLDEIPESFLFKGDPAALSTHDIFVFRRISGFEVIYFRGREFYSLFSEKAEDVPDNIIRLSRKFRRESYRIYSDLDFRISDDRFELQLNSGSDGDKLYVPEKFPLRKYYSNISENRNIKLRGKKFRGIHRLLTMGILLLLVAVSFNVLRYAKEKDKYETALKRYQVIEKRMTAIDRMQFGIDRILRKILAYPDVLNFHNIIADLIPEDTYLTEMYVDENLVIKGVSGNSIQFLEALRKHDLFKRSGFRTPVSKNQNSSQESFEIEIKNVK